MARDCIRLIRETQLRHRNYVDAFQEVRAYVSLAPPGSVIVLAGPTRVGKSSLVKEVLREAFPIDRARDDIASVYVDAATTDGRFISMRYLTLQLLMALEHPFYTDDSLGIRLSQTETTARIRLVKAIKHRGTKIVVVDEAQHLLQVKQRSEAPLDSLKCLGNQTGAVILLSGGYRLLATCFDSAHLNGRLSIVHFPRYRPTVKDIKDFDSILRIYDAMLPWSHNQSLISMRETLYEGTLGCLGLVTGWIINALVTMHARDERRLKTEHFRDTRFEEQIEPIRQEIALGEELLTKFRSFKAPRPSKPTSKKLRPGQRKPARDPVGV